MVVWPVRVLTLDLGGDELFGRNSTEVYDAE